MGKSGRKSLKDAKPKEIRAVLEDRNLSFANRAPTRAEFDDVLANLSTRTDEARTNKRMKRGLLAVVALMAMMAAVMTVANYGLIERSKESFVDPTTGRLLGRTGKSVEVKSLSSYTRLLDLTAFDINTLGQVKQLTLKMKTGLQVKERWGGGGEGGLF